MLIPLQAGTVIDAGANAAARRAAPADPVTARVTQSSTKPDAETSVHASGQSQRLIIEQDKPSGAFVYKTVDRVNGDLLFQYPSEELLRLRNNPAYVSGSVVSKSA